MERIIQDVEKTITNRKDILQHIPKCFSYLTNKKKVEFEIEYTTKDGEKSRLKKKVEYKTAHILDLIHKLMNKVENKKDTDDLCNLSSKVLRRLYGANYNYIIDYLLQEKFLHLVHGHLSGKFTAQYEVNTSMFLPSKGNQIRYRNEDKTIVKKYKSGYSDFNLNNISECVKNIKRTPLGSWIKRELAKDLLYVEIDVHASMRYLDSLYKEGKLTDKAYSKNVKSISYIEERQPLFSEDSYGRMHTNFTTLKKVIRNNYLKIDGFAVAETDIKNSQPRLLCQILKSENFDKAEPLEYKRYLETVKAGTLYEEIMSNSTYNRDDAKKLIYIVFFGENYETCRYNKTFRSLYPRIWEWIREYKNKNKNSSILAHQLQRIESNLIFENICIKIKKQIPEIKLFTVHDSIYYPDYLKERVEEIFFKEVESILM